MPLVRCSASSLSWRVETLDDVPLLQARARALLRGLDRLDSRAEWCVLIAASEAATNLVKHAEGGVLTLSWVDDPPHVLLETVDNGPGIVDPERATRDFVSEGEDLRDAPYVTARRGNGTGLGSIARSMGSLSLQNRPEGGLRLTARKHVR